MQIHETYRRRAPAECLAGSPFWVAERERRRSDPANAGERMEEEMAAGS